MATAQLVELQALQCAARQGATELEGIESLANCSDTQLTTALLTLVERYESAWKPPSRPAEYGPHIVR